MQTINQVKVRLFPYFSGIGWEMGVQWTWELKGEVRGGRSKQKAALNAWYSGFMVYKHCLAN